MDQALITIPLTKLALAFIPVLFVLILLAKWSMPTKRTVHALVRMLVQLLLVGFVLSYLFESQNAWIIGLLLLTMMFCSSYIALSNIDLTDIDSTQASLTQTNLTQANLSQADLARPKLTKIALFKAAFIAIFVSSVVVLLFITQGVLNLQPWYHAQVLIPLAGMVFANAMNSVSLCGERFYAELACDRSYKESREIAFKASMIPNINALFAVGIVSLPGMMTGQILAGVSPFIAARYQIMVMCMVFASAGLASAIFLILNKHED